MKRKIYLVMKAVLLLILFRNNALSQEMFITISSGEQPTITAALETPGLITAPVYKWYTAATGGTLLQTAPAFTPATGITADTAFYVSVEGSNYCVSSRLKVNLVIERIDEVIVCIGSHATIKASLNTPGSVTNPVFKWYDAATGGTLLYTGPEFTTPAAITADTEFYVEVEGDGYCVGARRKVVVKAEICTFPADKNAILLPNTFVQNGTYPNPVSVLGNEEIKYAISSSNPTAANAEIVIIDTLPAYLEYVSGTASPALVTTPPPVTTAPHNNPARQVLTWRFPSVAPNASVTVSFNAKLHAGAAASQPLLINRAMVSLVRSPGNSTHLQTNDTYHQGAGISIMTFSASFGGSIYNAGEQALDYMSAPSSGIIIAPEEGYKFAGWSHDGYTSLRGAAIEAQEGIMHYDTLMVYGNVELHANFVPLEAKLYDSEEEQHVAEAEDKVWSVKNELFIMTTKPGSIIRIYSTEGILYEQHTIVSPGTTSRKLPRGIYIVTIKNNSGRKIRIE